MDRWSVYIFLLLVERSGSFFLNCKSLKISKSEINEQGMYYFDAKILGLNYFIFCACLRLADDNCLLLVLKSVTFE